MAIINPSPRDSQAEPQRQVLEALAQPIQSTWPLLLALLLAAALGGCPG